MAQTSDADYILQLDLDCKDCVRNVKKALSPFYGIEYMNIAVNEDKVYLKGNVEIMKVVEAVRKKTKKQTELIYPGPSTPHDKEVVVDLKVPFDCGKCVKKVRETIMNIDGVFFVEIDANNDKVKVKGHNISGEMICCKLCSKLGIYSEILPPKKVEIKPAEKKGEAKPAEKKGEAKPAEKKGEAKPAEKKEEAKPAEKKGEAKPAEKKGDAKPAEKKGDAKPAEKKGEAKPAEKKGEGGSKPEPKKEDTKPKPKAEPEKGKDVPPAKKEAPKQEVLSKCKDIIDGDIKICVINNFYYPPPYIFSDENPNAYCSVM